MSTMEKCGPLQQQQQKKQQQQQRRHQRQKQNRVAESTATTSSSSSSNHVLESASGSCSNDSTSRSGASEDDVQVEISIVTSADIDDVPDDDAAATAVAAGAPADVPNCKTNPPQMPPTPRLAAVGPAADDQQAGPSGINADNDDDDDDEVDVENVEASTSDNGDDGSVEEEAAMVPTPTEPPHVPTSAINRKDARLIADLRAQIPKVFSVFNLHQRIGEGTFSTVYLATLRSHENRPFHKRKFFAIKHLIPTSHPNRVERELRCMLEIGGTENVVGVDLCMRSGDSVAFVMPYVRHDKFHDYFNRFDARELQTYMRNLLIAIRRVHSFGVIHRDVKPSNFLHDRKAKKYLLVDFGLAQCAGVRPTTTSITATKTATSTSDAAVVPGSDSGIVANAEATTSAAVSAVAATTTEQPEHDDGGQPPSLTPQTNSFRNSSSAQCNPPRSSNSQSVAVMPMPTKKRKAAEIEETENCSNTSANAAKRNRSNQLLQQQLQHENTVNQYSAVDDANASNDVASAATPSPTVGAPAAPQQASSSSFKQPLKQLNEISTPKSGVNTSCQKQFKKEDVPLLRQVKAAILSYSLANQQAQRRIASPNTPRRATAGGSGSAGGVACYCYGKPTICNLCIIKKEVHASRAGTPGYRPPEVLLKSPEQTTAVDMWAIGVIMISILSACYPFFKGNDDFIALAEMVTVFGDEAIKKAALSMSRHICHSQKKRPLHLRKLCIRLRSRSGANTICTTDTTRRPPVPPPPPSTARHTYCDNCQQISPECLCTHSPLNMDFSTDIFPASAYDLMSKLLCINPAQRITAEEALQHPFLWADL